MEKNFLKEALFPFEDIRPVQEAMVRDIYESLQKRKHVVVHAPTGIGKTVSAIAPALSIALKKNLTVFFLTSRQTQHAIAIETLKKIRQEYSIRINVADMIGKKSMCLQKVDDLDASDFLDHCRKLRERDECSFYLKTRKKSREPTVEAQHAAELLSQSGPLMAPELIHQCSITKHCPYEIATMLAKDSNVIVADYNVIFSEAIRTSLFARIGKKIEDCIIIVDEAHNLPARCRDLLTVKLSTIIIERAAREAVKFEFFRVVEQLKKLYDTMHKLGSELDFNHEEKLVRKYAFIDALPQIDEIALDCAMAAETVKEQQRHSYLGSVAEFLKGWQGPDMGFARIIRLEQEGISLHYKCLDPSLLTKGIVDSCYAMVMMSGTLAPTLMYRDLVAIENSLLREYPNPFPQENRLCLIVPNVTTKFSRRNDEEFQKIAVICSAICDQVPGNTALFFPSYQFKDKILHLFSALSKKETFSEKKDMNAIERAALIEDFKGQKDIGAVLFAVSSGSFGEGIDLPGDLLKAVVIVGLPLEKPDLETKELIDYYEEKFAKGMDYGYIFPAISKCLQNAGRCIRSETDKGVIVFLDERFAWDNYKRCFPKDMEFKITNLYEDRIRRFFNISG